MGVNEEDLKRVIIHAVVMVVFVAAVAFGVGWMIGAS